jgi:hypothetical protein
MDEGVELLPMLVWGEGKQTDELAIKQAIKIDSSRFLFKLSENEYIKKLIHFF